MTRVFTKETGRWKKGDIREYPFTTWQQIERGAKQKLDVFSTEVDDAARTMVTNIPDAQKPISRKVV